MAELEPLQSPSLAGVAGVRHGFFTRQGGVSHGIYASLNAGRGSKDDPACVEENRGRIAAWFGVEPQRLITAYQIHSATAHVIDQPPAQPLEGDALVTRAKVLVCGALSADCAPVLIADADAGLVAATHAGWRGALDGVVAATVEALVSQGGRPSRMVAAVGPCIGPASYEVGLEFLERFVAAEAGHARFFATGGSADKRLFDLPGFVLQTLERAGVGRAEWIGRDTVAEDALFFSNRRAVRRADGDYGRLLSAIMLRD